MSESKVAASTASIIASEGGAGYYPENTAYAVRQSIAAGVDGCELDFHLTADNKFVAHHDYRLNPAITRHLHGDWLTEPGPLIKQATLSQLYEFDLGSLDPDAKLARRYPARQSHSPELIATFQDIEEAFASPKAATAQLWFEAKTDPFNHHETTPPARYVNALTKVLSNSPLFSRTVLIAFDWDLLALAQQAMPNLQTGFLTVDFSWLTRGGGTPDQKLVRWYGNFNPADYGNSIPRAVAAAGGSYWSPFCRDLTKAAVQEAHELGIKVSTWGANTVDEIDQALDMAVDSLTTGYVDRAYASKRRGLPGS